MLKKYRKKIDKIDKKLIKLFEKRMDVARCVGEYKKENNLEILDTAREKEILENRVMLTKNSEYKEYTSEFLESLMNVSKKLQSKK
ncbi:MAG: chorismate mutase [Clostridia bacterium]|nr:chorismate mutase [Clostridia bacterium]